MLSVQRKDLRLLALALAFNTIYSARLMIVVFNSTGGILTALTEKYTAYEVIKAYYSLTIIPSAIFLFLLVRSVMNEKSRNLQHQ